MYNNPHKSNSNNNNKVKKNCKLEKQFNHLFYSKQENEQIPNKYHSDNKIQTLDNKRDNQDNQEKILCHNCHRMAVHLVISIRNTTVK